MIGAHKIDPTTDDLTRIFEMIDAGMNDTQIHREYRTNSNETLSREHISKIRKRERWNLSSRSFIMKEEIQDLPVIHTKYNGRTFKTEIAAVYSKSKEMWFFFDYIDGNLQDEGLLHFKVDYPSIGELSDHHKRFLDNASGDKNRKNKN